MNNNYPTANLPISIRKLSSNKFIEDICQGQFEDQSNILFEDSFINKIKEGDVVEGVITRVNPNDI
ncbi:30S ribosomal protein S1, partial [Wolbachia endosymbiont of Tettigetta isshikii]